MRNILPLLGIGFTTLIVLGIIVAGIVMITMGVGDSDIFKKDAAPGKPKIQNAPNQPLPGPQPLPKDSQTLLDARKGFATKLIQSDYQRSGRDLPVVPQAKSVTFRSPVGNLSAYLSIPLKKNALMPAVIWVHDGFGGVTEKDWSIAKPFHDAGFVLMVPSFREENVNNGGRFEMFFGEVEDLMAAIEFVGKQNGVDPNRIYVVGHGTGGTLTLLAAATGTRSVRAFFAIGGTPDLEEALRDPQADPFEDAAPPFDPKLPNEARLRSSLAFVAAIRQPTFFFGATMVDPQGCSQARRMETTANQYGVPFRVFEILKATRANFPIPLVTLVRQKIESDTASNPTSTIRIEYSQVTQLFNK